MRFKNLFMAAFSLAAFSAASVYAQLPASSFGISAAFSTSGATQAQFLYTPSTNFQIDFGVGYTNQSIDLPDGAGDDPEPTSSVGINAGGKYFINANTVSPFIGLAVSYGMGPNTKQTSGTTTTEQEGSSLGVSFQFGAQSFISKNVALFGAVGLGYSKSTMKTTTTTTIGGAGNSTSSEIGTSGISFTGSQVGASFYF